jgi:hypothetical protein
MATHEHDVTEGVKEMRVSASQGSQSLGLG